MIAIYFAIVIVIVIFVSVMFAKLHGDDVMTYLVVFLMLIIFGSVLFNLGKTNKEGNAKLMQKKHSDVCR